MQESVQLVCISVGDLLNKEIFKKSDYGKLIVESRKTYSYVKDEIVTELVKNQIEALEKEQKSWIIEGFPRTRQQALALLKMGIIPDKFFLLDVFHNLSIDKVCKNLMSEEAVVQFKEDMIEQLAENALSEYKLYFPVTDYGLDKSKELRTCARARSLRSTATGRKESYSRRSSGY